MPNGGDLLGLLLQSLSLLLGILGAVAFYWQVRQRRARRVRFLNASVLRPWSKVQTKRYYRSPGGRPAREVRLAIPKEAVPEEVDPTVGADGLDIEDLPGLGDGQRFLRRPSLSRLLRSEHEMRARCRGAWREWEAVVELRREYEEARERRRSLLEPMIAKDMEAAYPRLRPVSYQEMAVDTYDLASILAKVEADSEYSTRPGWSGPRVQASRHSEQGGYLYINDSYHLASVSLSIDPDESRFVRLIAKWIAASPVDAAAREMGQSFEQIESTLERFRESMKDLAFGLDLRFRAEE